MSLRQREVLTGTVDEGPPIQLPQEVFPLVSIGLMVTCVAAYVLALIQGGEDVSRIYQAGILYGPWVRDAGESWRAFTTVFTHAGPLHLVMNMSVLWTLGAPLERLLGHKRFLFISLVTAMGSGAMVLLFSFDKPTVGASGMILGYLGVTLPIASARARSGLLTWLIQIAVVSLLPGVSWQGHLGGFLAGLPLGWALRGGPSRFGWSAPLILAVTASALLLAARGGLP